MKKWKEDFASGHFHPGECTATNNRLPPSLHNPPGPSNIPCHKLRETVGSPWK